MNTNIPTNDLTTQQKINICTTAHNLATTWRTDTLDCTTSPLRKPTNTPIQQAIGWLNNPHLFNITHRHNDIENHIEIFIRTMHGQTDNFLWIQIENQHLNTILQHTPLKHPLHINNTWTWATYHNYNGPIDPTTIPPDEQHYHLPKQTWDKLQQPTTYPYIKLYKTLQQALQDHQQTQQ